MTSMTNTYHAQTQQRLAIHAGKFNVDVSDRSAQYPQEFESIFPNAKLALLGAGDWVFGWSSVDQRLDYLTDITGTTRYVYAPDLVRPDGSVNEQAWAQLRERFPGLARATFGTIMRRPDDIPDSAICFIFSPNRLHDDQLHLLIRSPNSKAVYVEKPMAINGDELQRLDELVRLNNKKICFGDHYLFAGVGLFALMGKHMPYKNLLTTDSDELRQAVERAAPVLRNIKKIEARNIFTGHENLLRRRRWLQKASEGGGVLLDLQVHLSNVFHALGFAIGELLHVECQVRPPELDYKYEGGENDPTLGIYDPLVQSDDDLAEDRAFMQGLTRSGATFEFEVAQFAAKKDQANYFQLIDDDNKKLRLSFDLQTVEYLNEQDQVIGKVEQKVDAVLLMMHYALSYFHSDEDNAPLFYQEQRASIEFIEKVKSFWYGSMAPNQAA